nr:hypothetical protein [Tanacetum cinerariifolium]
TDAELQFDFTSLRLIGTRPGPTGQPVDVGSPLVDHLTVAVDDDQVESSSFSKDKGVSGFELVVVGEGCSEQSVIVVEGSKKRRSITEALKEEATIMRPDDIKKEGPPELKEPPRQQALRGSDQLSHLKERCREI